MNLYSHDGKLYHWNNDLVEQFNDMLIVKGDSLTCEYRLISIVSDNFDNWSQSEIMLTNFVKHSTSKDAALESITYYDDDANTKTIVRNGKKYRKIKIGPFDSSEYGHSVCFHTPGYKGTTINITTKMWEINDSSSLSSLLNVIKEGVGLAGTAAGVPYMNIVNNAFGISNQILIGFIQHSELCPNHTLELRLDSDNHPLLRGKYVCIPGLDNLNEKIEIIQKYELVDNLLVTTNSEGLYQEYDKTYFVLKVSNKEREDLADFDFSASSSNLLSKINQKEINMDEICNDILKIQKDSYDLKLIKNVQEDYKNYMNTNSEYIEEKENLLRTFKASYKQLKNINKEQLEWFEQNFESIKTFAETIY